MIMKQCFGYVRVSTQKQGEGVSLEAQCEAIKTFARRNDLTVAAWFEEKETAAKSGRPVFNRMVQALFRGEANGVIMHRIDRSSRNLKDWATIGDLSDAGIDVHFATETLDFRSRGGRLTADIQAVIAADYIRNLQIETRKGIDGRLKQGLYPFPAPVGYIDNGGGKAKTLDPVRAPMVRELFDRYLSGDYSIRTLHLAMADEGLTAKCGRRISKRAIENVLQNPFYCGLMRNGRTGEIFPGTHEPIISKREFDRVQDIKAGRYVKKRVRHRYLHRRLFHCAACKTILTPERQKGRVYYRCHTVGCSTRTVREDLLDRAILDALLRYEIPERSHGRLHEEYRQWKVENGHEANLKSVKLRIQEARSRLERVTDMFIDGTIDQATHDQKRQTLQGEIRDLKDREAEIANWSESDEDRRAFFELMKSLAGLYVTAGTDERRLLVQNCFSNRRWNGKYVELEPSSLISEAQTGLCVPYGGPIRDTLRTFVRKFDNRKDSEDEHLEAA